MLIVRGEFAFELGQAERVGDAAAQRADVVTLHGVDSGGTDLSLVVDVEPEGFMESAGDELGVISYRIEADLSRFVAYVESGRDHAPGTGAVTKALGKGGTPSNQLTERITPGD